MCRNNSKPSPLPEAASVRYKPTTAIRATFGSPISRRVGPAGNSESCGPIYGCPDPVALAVSSWTDSQIVIIGFTGGYGKYALNTGDHTELYLWNPQTGAGPATYENVVQAAGGNTGTSASCASGSGAAGKGPVCITMVSPILPQQFQTITITGSGFGTLQAYNGNSSYIRITDLTTGWSAGNSESCGPIYGCPDPVALAVSSWTDSQIVIIGFTGGYGKYTLNTGDHTELFLWNPQTGVGPATYENVVQAATSTTSPPPSITPGSVVTASAFGAFTSAAAGTWIEIYGSNLAVDTRGWSVADFSGKNAPTSLDGTSVTIGGQQAFVGYISPTQVNALIPSNMPIGQQQLIITTPAGTSLPYNLSLSAVEPGLLAPPNFKIAGTQYVAALFADGTYVLPTGAIAGLTSRPARPGDTLVVYGVGFGPVTPDTPAGQLVGAASTLASHFTISIGGVQCQVQYDGLAPSYTGLYQFNIVIPSGLGAGPAPLTFTVGGVIAPRPFPSPSEADACSSRAGETARGGSLLWLARSGAARPAK